MTSGELPGDVGFKQFRRAKGIDVRQACTLAGWKRDTYYRRRTTFKRVPLDFVAGLADHYGVPRASLLSSFGLT